MKYFFVCLQKLEIPFQKKKKKNIFFVACMFNLHCFLILVI
ncbi:unnamed protein product [Penicillium nalgiovense]|nr:unnamed protein product [Penicillium nalgiovense]